MIEKLQRHWSRLEKGQKDFYEKQAEEENKRNEIMKAVRRSRAIMSWSISLFSARR